MLVQQLYEQLQIPPNLQEHQLRVGALLKILCQNWQGEPLDSQSITLAGLFHDAANILKFDFSKPALLGSEVKNLNHWRQVQTTIRQQYGDNIHLATLAMCREIYLSAEALRIIKDLEWDRTESVLKIHDWPVALAIYADMRVGPFGILSYQDRIFDLHTRKPLSNYQELLDLALQLETQLQTKISITITTVTDLDLEKHFSSLRNLAIKCERKQTLIHKS